MANVKVLNLNDYDYEEMYNGTLIRIPAKGHVTMEYFEANQFLGKMNPLILDKEGRIDKKSYKMLRIDSGDLKDALDELNAPKTDEKDAVYVCHSCGKDFRTKKGLLTHIKRYHQGEMVDKDARDELLDDEEI